MTLTSFDFDFDDSGTLELDCETLAELTERTHGEISGLFGGGVIGKVTINRDGSMGLDDLLGGACAGEAVGPTRYTERSNWHIPASIDSRDPNVQKILDARERLFDRHDPDDYGTYGFRVLQRFAKMLGYKWDLAQLENFHRDCVGVYTITPKGQEKNSSIEDYRTIFQGDVFDVEVELISPIGGEVFRESMGMCVGEDWALEMAGELANDALWTIRQQVREAVKER